MDSIEPTVILILSVMGFIILDEINSKIKQPSGSKVTLYCYAVIIAAASLYGAYLGLSAFKNIVFLLTRVEGQWGQNQAG